MKRSSRLVTADGGVYDAAGESANIMLQNAVDLLGAAGYAPYYLYRQRNTLGGLENIGFSKPGFEGLYNVFIMDETHTILAAGAGGVTKMRQPGGGLIERVFNFKYPYEYISRFGEIISRKKKVKEFYANFPKNDGQS
jgi:oxygen-independent coproporphyrinogen-3 oxidase